MLATLNLKFLCQLHTKSSCTNTGEIVWNLSLADSPRSDQRPIQLPSICSPYKSHLWETTRPLKPRKALPQNFFLKKHVAKCHKMAKRKNSLRISHIEAFPFHRAMAAHWNFREGGCLGVDPVNGLSPWILKWPPDSIPLLFLFSFCHFMFLSFCS